MSQYADLTALIKDLAGARAELITEPVLDQVANEIFMDQTANVPVKTGALRSGISIQARQGWRFVGPSHAKTPYDVFVEFGTRPHVIEASPGKTLSFKVGGQQVFAKRVNHPGTRPNPFVANSMRRWRETLGDKMALAVVKQVQRGD